MREFPREYRHVDTLRHALVLRGRETRGKHALDGIRRAKQSAMNRRSWILGGALAAGAAGSSALYARSRFDVSEKSKATLTKRSGPFAVREGFECTVVTRAGEPQSDHTRTPDLPDGMACFASSDGNWVLLRNHEIMRDSAMGAYPGGQPKEAYKKTAHGGVSRIVLNPKSLEVISSNMVLTGTMRNCAGGPSPWGWISCEEATEPEHGYSFLCSKDATRVQPPQRLSNYGRFRHEAVALDPKTLQAYLTEDDPMGCLYRFSPHDRKRPFEGVLEALRVVGRPGLHTDTSLMPQASVKVDWVRVADPVASSEATRLQAQREGAALFSRGEGAWLDGDGMVFTATSGGKLSQGQLFRIDFAEQTLTLVAEAQSPDDFSGPDNITVAPWGDFIVAEDGPGPAHLFLVRADGTMEPLLRNAVSTSELAGVCFSPDGSVLFCNAQYDGLTVAVRGPWDSLQKGFA